MATAGICSRFSAACFTEELLRRHGIAVRSRIGRGVSVPFERRLGRQKHLIKPTLNREELSQPLAEDDPRRFQVIMPPYDDKCPHVFSDPMCNKFINVIMRQGRKYLSRRIFQEALEIIKRERVKEYNSCTDPLLKEALKSKCNPREIFKTAIENCKPVIGVKPVMKGGMTYQVPCAVTEMRAEFLAMQWLRDTAREKLRTMHMEESLAKEIIDASNKEGRVYKKKLELHKLAEANRAYAHYRSV